MAGIEVTAAAGAGFGLIGKRPLTVLAWGLLVVVLVGLPVAALMGAVLPDIIEAARQTQMTPGAPPPIQQFAAIGQQIGAIQGPVFALALLVGTVLTSAIFRAVLEPKNSAFAYLRLGGKELWLFILGVAQWLFWAVVFAMSMMALVATYAVTARYASQGAGVLATLAAGAVVIFLLIVLALRLAMAGPMTFMAGEFRMFQSWRLTRGHAGEIFLVALLIFVITFAVGIVMQVVMRLALLPAMIAFAHAPDGPEHLKAMFAGTPQALLARYWPYVVGLVLGGAIYSGVVRAIVIAPWAAVYRQLRPEAAEGQPEPRNGGVARPLVLGD